jgi:TolB-like protein
VRAGTEEVHEPEALPPSEKVIESSPLALPAPAPAYKRHLRAVVLAAACLAVAAAAWALLFFRRPAAPTQPAPIRSVAVLPLRNTSGDPADEYFSDGMTESLIAALSKVEGLKVISRGSVFRYKEKEVDPREAGRQLGVAAVVEGSMWKDGERVRVIVQLVDTADGRVLWAGEPFDREMRDIFSLQDEIARKVVSGLRLKLGGEGQLTKEGTNNVEAYQLYLRGRYHWDKLTSQELEKSIGYFQQAIKLDPDYALAYAGLADSYTRLAIVGRLRPTDVMPEAKAAIVRALEIDDSLAEAHATLGFIRYIYDWEWAGAEQEFKRAIELNPNSSFSRHQYSYYLSDTGRFDESFTQIQRAIELDPLSTFITKDGGQIFYLARRYDQAIEYLQKALDLDPHFGSAYFWLERCYKAMGLHDQAIEMEFRKMAIREYSPEEIAAHRAAYAASGWKGFWRKRLELMERGAKQRHVEPYYFAAIYARLGEKEQSLGWLEKAYKERSLWLTSLNNEPLFDDLRSEPRFQDLVRRIGNTP